MSDTLGQMDQNDIIDSIMSDLGAAVESHKSSGAGVPVVFLREGQARIKFLLDKNNKLAAQANVYQVPGTGADGKPTTLRCIATEPDQLRPIVDQIGGWKYRPRFTAAIYAYVISSNWKDKNNNAIKDQLVKLVVNKTFLKSLNEVFKGIVSNSKNKFMSLVSKEPGLAFNISITGSGMSAVITITPDAFGGEVAVPDEIAEKIGDITDIYVIPKKEFNDQNTSLVKAELMKILEESKSFTDKPSASDSVPTSEESSEETPADASDLPF